MKHLQKTINGKMKELKELVCTKESLQNEDVYKKSCELDRLVVQYMKVND